MFASFNRRRRSSRSLESEFDPCCGRCRLDGMMVSQGDLPTRRSPRVKDHTCWSQEIAVQNEDVMATAWFNYSSLLKHGWSRQFTVLVCYPGLWVATISAEMKPTARFTLQSLCHRETFGAGIGRRSAADNDWSFHVPTSILGMAYGNSNNVGSWPVPVNYERQGQPLRGCCCSVA